MKYKKTSEIRQNLRNK